jgi:hypothetical protein
MKKIVIAALMLLLISPVYSQQNASFFNEANAFFQKNVTNGAVNYSEISQNKSDLISLVDQIGNIELSKTSEAEKKALLINAYNILVIKGIVDNYPTKSPLDINGFFDGIRYKVGGKNMTLNELEKDNLIKPTGDERLHFVLVCAAISCPPIASFAYTPNELEQQIKERTELALSNSEFSRIDQKGKKVLISEIFPNEIRGKASSFAVLCLWAAYFVLVFTFPILAEKLGTFGPFWMYSFICLLGFWFIKAKVKETKGKTLEQMEDVFSPH